MREELCEAYGVGRAFAYQEIKAGRLVAKKVGTGRGRTLIPFENAESWA